MALLKRTHRLWDRSMTELKKTPLYDLHVSLGAKMTAFAGYDMPVQYKDGVLKEHLHTREKAGLFDVSHMGQGAVVASDYETAALALERVAPAEILKLKPGRQRYTVLLNDQGGVLDDLIVAHPAQDGRVNFVVNAACKDDDFAYMQAQLPQEVSIERYDDRALLALQGPEAAAVQPASLDQKTDRKDALAGNWRSQIVLEVWDEVTLILHLSEKNPIVF